MNNKLKEGEALFAEGKIEEAEECFLSLVENDLNNQEAYNNLGVIAFQKDDTEKAIDYFNRSLEINPFYRDAIVNYTNFLMALNQPQIAVPLLEKIAETNPDDEIIQLLEDIRSIPQSRSKIAILCLPEYESFLGDIVNFLKNEYDVRTCYTNNEQEIESAVEWADIVWLEWANQMATHVTNNVSGIINKKVICRVHGYEVFTDMPAHINWNVVDRLIFVAKHKQEIFNQKFKAQSLTQFHIRNGVNTDTFNIMENKTNTKRLVLLGHLNFRKGLPMLLQFYHELLKHDPEYHLYIRGTFQEPKLAMAVETMIHELSLEKKIEFVDWVDDLNTWLADKSHILSFSIEESFHYSIGNGMAAGLKPVIHAWTESREIWPKEFIFNDLDSFFRIMLDETFEPERYRQLILENHNSSRQLGQIKSLLEDLGKKKRIPTDITPVTSSHIEIKKRSTKNLKRNIFLIGLKRSGTTISWNTFRQDTRLISFDEPFCLHLLGLAEGFLEDKKKTMEEYSSRIELIRDYWIPIGPDEELKPHFRKPQIAYLRKLLETSRNVCIDFVRCHYKIDHLRKLFPEAFIIHLVRDPRAFATSHLKPYGKWTSPDLPEKFFEYDGWFDFWQYQTLAKFLGTRGRAFEKLLQLWKHFTDIAEQQKPDMTIQFEDFATNPEKVVRNIYEKTELEYIPLDFSEIHTPNQPFKANDEAWTQAIDKYELNRNFVYNFS